MERDINQKSKPVEATRCGCCKELVEIDDGDIRKTDIGNMFICNECFEDVITEVNAEHHESWNQSLLEQN